MGVTARLTRDTFTVREDCTVSVEVHSTRPLEPGDTVEVQFPNSWYVDTGPSFTRPIQTADPLGRHYLSAATGDGRSMVVEAARRHLPFTAGPARHGRLIVATAGEGGVDAMVPVRITYANTFAPYIAEEETVSVAAVGHRVDEPPAIRVMPGPAESVRVIVASSATPGEAFDVLVVSLDRFENRSSTSYSSETLALEDGAVLAQGLDFTGSVRVTVTLDEPGIYRFSCLGAISNAIRVSEDVCGPFWGDIHIHTKLSGDGQGTLPYDYARDVSGLDFAAVTDHAESLGVTGCETLLEWARLGNRPGRFVTILADERNPAALSGHHNMYFRDEETWLSCRVSAGPADDGLDLKSLPREKVMLIPHHTGIAWGGLVRGDAGAAVDLLSEEDFSLRRSAEIYSHHGQSEQYAPQHVLSYEFNRIRNPERRANTSVPGPFWLHDWWKAGRRLGVIASSDEHSGRGGLRHGGIAAVWAQALTRDGLFEAINQRRSYATTGERILVDFEVAGEMMGGVVTAGRGGQIELALSVWGTENLLRVEILRCSLEDGDEIRTILSEAPRPESRDFRTMLRESVTGPSMYYARVVQEPVERPAMAWTSPVWVETC